MDWSTGGRIGGVSSGDRVFMLRQGTQGRGIVASGTVVSEIYRVQAARSSSSDTGVFSVWKSDREEVAVTIQPKPVRPGPGQESVWDYPRPPRLERFVGSITVELGGKTIASTTRAWRVLETSHPPTYYLPRDAFFVEVCVEGLGELLRPGDQEAGCAESGMELPQPQPGLRTDRWRGRGNGRKG
jgi:hypothetical protein